MFTEFVRDHTFTIAWFGLMMFVWAGWAQEDPPPRWRIVLGVMAVIGAGLAGAFGYGVFSRWAQPSALTGKYAWFGVIVGIEVLAAGLGSGLLVLRHQPRWICWWIALVVAVHFIPLAWFLQDTSLVGLGVVQLVGLVLLFRRLAGQAFSSSRYAAPWMALSLFAFSLASTILFLSRHHTPW